MANAKTAHPVARRLGDSPSNQPSSTPGPTLSNGAPSSEPKGPVPALLRHNENFPARRIQRGGGNPGRCSGQARQMMNGDGKGMGRRGKKKLLSSQELDLEVHIFDTRNDCLKFIIFFFVKYPISYQYTAFLILYSIL